MGTLDRIVTDRNGRMLIPANVTGMEYQDGLNVKQAVALGALGLLTFISVAAFKESALATPKGWTALIILLLIVYQFVIRYIVIGETYLAKQTMLLKVAQDKVPADLWNVINIDDDGIIYFQDGRLGLIICAEQATIVGRSADYKSVHYSAISDFYKTLNQNQIKWMHINAMVNARTENRLSRISERLIGCQNQGIRKMCETHLAFLRGLEVRTLYEKEYWLLKVGSAYGKDMLLRATNDAGEYLQAAAFNRYEILPKEECYELCCQLLNLNSFDAQSIMIEKAQRIVSTPLGVIKQIKFRDDLNPQKIADIEKALKLYKDGSEFVPLTDDTYQLNLGTVLINMLTTKLRFLINNKQSIGSGYIRTNCFNIKWSESTNSDSATYITDEEDDEVFDIGATTEESLFGTQYLNVDTVEDLEAHQAAQEAEAEKINAQLGIEQRAAAERTAAEKKAAALRQKEEQEELARQLAEEEAKREAERKEAEEREAKRFVSSDEFEETE